MRGWLNNVRSYVPPVAIGDKMRGATLATVIHSRIPGIQQGDIVSAPVTILLYKHLTYTDVRGENRQLVGVNIQLPHK